jgi:CheY-like chemotaxis protein
MCRILLVEDDRDIRESMAGLLSLSGHTIHEAEDGRKALDWLTAHRHDRACLAIVDLMMPIMNGWEFLAALRRDPHCHRLYVIVLSALRSFSAFGDAVPADAFWPKPPHLEQLDRLRNHCPYHSASRPAREMK